MSVNIDEDIRIEKNINGEETIVSVIDANVNYPSVNFDNGQYSFDISL